MYNFLKQTILRISRCIKFNSFSQFHSFQYQKIFLIHSSSIKRESSWFRIVPLTTAIKYLFSPFWRCNFPIQLNNLFPRSYHRFSTTFPLLLSKEREIQFHPIPASVPVLLPLPSWRGLELDVGLKISELEVSYLSIINRFIHVERPKNSANKI